MAGAAEELADGREGRAERYGSTPLGGAERVKTLPGGLTYPASMLDRSLSRFALVVVDAQQGFDDAEFWGRRDNPACDDNIAALVAAWSEHGRPLVYVQHDSASSASPLHPDSSGHQLKDYLSPDPDLLVNKSVNSSFHGSPDLDAWLREQQVAGIVVCGITTNHCCETTARVGGNLGHRVLFALDATHTFDRLGPDGRTVPAETLAQVTAANLHGEFAEVVSTAELLG